MRVVTRSEPGDPEGANQDRAGYSGCLAWVIDGATNLDEVAVTPGDDDAAWLAEATHKFLMTQPIDEHESFDTYFARLSVALKAQYMGFVREAAKEPKIFPSAGLAAVRWQGSMVDYFILGDCSVTVVDPEASTSKTVQEETLHGLDAVALHELVDLRRQGFSFDQAKSRLKPTLRRHRQLMNVDSGYWVFGFDPQAVSHALQGRLEVTSDTVVLLASDGFSRLWDTLDVFGSGWEVYQAIRANGVDAVMRRLRTTENQDPEADRWPRFKKCDDASVAMISFVREKPGSLTEPLRGKAHVPHVR